PRCSADEAAPQLPGSVMLARMREMDLDRAFILACCMLAASSAFAFGQVQKDSEWPAYGNDPGGMRYARDAQIDRDNVAKLKVAWTYRTGANDTPTELKRKAAFEATPILVDGKLFLSTPYDHV